MKTLTSWNKGRYTLVTLEGWPWQFLATFFLEILVIHVKVAKNRQKLPKIAKIAGVFKNCDFTLTLTKNFKTRGKAGKQSFTLNYN